MSELAKHIFQNLSEENADLIRHYFRKPGGRKYLENITLILINTLPHSFDEKEELYRGFVNLMDNIQQGIRQKEGEEILQLVFNKG